ncbi:transporter substrate-binding domain-containing protein [Mangrovicoccus algicola]|uniref:Transporter substrate-binding domain-containing protein n=1 Tax=Mangrovicoccus algicola TaxID=2771008 RepID=A0A8J6YY91_9RHOB|nr:transporter substrate-binding domain-containing protein [Mangrovicoccus algicola]MBE3638136.1 transporter substrate-binding domain-containing protein [Mangrovicoccus algicola]
MVRTEIQIGILFSRTGPYGTIAHSQLNGAMLACSEINADPKGAVSLIPEIRDPGGRLENYASDVKSMLGKGIRHVCGCYTSSSRKEVIPLFEKHDALLWYPTHYEGFESATNVIYTGAAPNHHMSPLIDYLCGRFGQRAYCVGSNYIWGWESNRVMRDGLQRRGGTVLAERYMAVGDTDLDAIVDEILELRPDFVFNALIGVSSYTLFRTLRAACQARGIDQPREVPVASCNLSEPELEEIGADSADGQISSSVYFSSLQSSCNAAFVAAYHAAYPEGPRVSAEAEAAYIAIHLMALAIAEAGSDEADAVREAVAGRSFEAPQGCVTIDPLSFHASLTPRIAVSRKDFEFDILLDTGAPVEPDPYLVGSMTCAPRPARANVRIVK